MNLKSIIPLVAAMVTLAAFTSSGGSAATSTLIDPGSLIDAACLTGTADKTLLLGAGVNGVSASSESLGFSVAYDGAGYGSRYRRCRSFVVDIEVPSNSSAPGYQRAFKIEAVNAAPWAADPDFWAMCDGREEATFVYRKHPSQGGFKLVAKKILHGTVSGGQCVMQTVSNVWPSSFSPSKASTLASTETYRIVTRASDRFRTNWTEIGVLYWHRLVVAAHLPST